MPRDAIHLNGVVQEEDRQIIKIGEGDGEKSYVLRMMTRDVRRKINAVQRKLEELDTKRATTDLDLDTYYDQGVDLYLEGVDVLLEIDTSGESKHRTPASKQLRAQYQENKLGWSQVANYYAGLRDETEATRPI
jgi:hypothetical protein